MAWLGIGYGGLLVIALALGTYVFFIAKNALGSQGLSAVPGWVPKPADLSGGISLFHADSALEVAGQFTGKSPMDA